MVIDEDRRIEAFEMHFCVVYVEEVEALVGHVGLAHG